MKGALRFLICGALFLSASAQDIEAQNTADTPWKKTETVGSTWRGFPTSTFPIEKWTLVVALPTAPLEGNPWIMKIEDAGDSFHWQINKMLLDAGVAVVSLNTYNTYGAPCGIAAMDSVYNFVVNRFGLSTKCSLGAISRAGLSVYRWAAAHPALVNAIYCEGPVMDFTTWPMRWPESAANWKELKELYGFKSDAEALVFKENPIDLLPVIAKAGIRLRHVVSVTNEHDTRVVPNKSNTFRAAGILSGLGHGMDLAILPPETSGPPYPTDSASVRFIIEASLAR